MEEFAYYNKIVDDYKEKKLNEWFCLINEENAEKKKSSFLKKLPQNACEQYKAIEEIIKVFTFERWKNLKRDFPKIADYLFKTGDFYKNYFKLFSKMIVREKRQLFFMTPSRIHASYEYTLSLDECFFKDEDASIFLFNLNKRCLDWLEIKLGDQVLPIASKNQIQKEVVPFFGTEWESFYKACNMNAEECFSLLYKASGNYPCFVRMSKLRKKNCFLTIDYKNSSKRTKTWIDDLIHCWNGFLFQGTASYWYNSINPDCTHWLYVTAPPNFDIKVNCDKGQENDSSDEEVKSFSFQIREPAEFKITMSVPSSLKTWYWIVRVLSYFLITMNIAITNVPRLQSLQTNEFVADLLSIHIGFIAVIAATRGWMIHEEHVLSFVSKELSCYLLIFLIHGFCFFISM